MNKSFSQLWLATLSGMIPDVRSGYLMIPQKQQMRQIAFWPQTGKPDPAIDAIVKYALKQKKQACIPNAVKTAEQNFDYFALPVYTRNELLAVLIFQLMHQPETHRKPIFKRMLQGVQWLRLGQLGGDSHNDEFYSRIVGLLASSFEQSGFRQTLIKMLTELTISFECERVAFGEFKHGHSKVIALSNSADFDHRSNMVKQLADVMDEAIEQDTAINFPDAKTRLVKRSHNELSRKFGVGSILTIPLVDNETPFGAICFLRGEDTPFDPDSTNLALQVLSLMTPYLLLKQDQEKSLLLKFVDKTKAQLGRLFGIRRLKLKLAAVLLLLLIGSSSLIETDFRITANAVLEGKIQRVVAAPISGYLLSAAVRAGDTVKTGDEMARLNDAELKLELTRLEGELQKARREYREAQSSRNLVQVRVISEQIKQIDANIELTAQRLDKIHLTAPFDGVVIEGDLSQMLGTPVERGDTLFKIAPLDGYRIILKVDEREIAHISEGQRGQLTLSSLPDQQLDLRIEKITAIAKAEDGANIFRVKASLENPPELLRPGMEGISKIDIGREKVLWIWTRHVSDWLRLWFWSWWP